MKAKIREIKQAGWEAEGVSLFGDKMRNWKFVCPCCGFVQSGNDFLAAGADVIAAQSMLGFSCIGRLSENSREAFGEGPGPCNYAGGGIFPRNPVIIILENGEKTSRFEFYRGEK